MSSISPPGLLNVFEPGLLRGSTQMGRKHYAYVEHPTEGWRVYLRSACFLHEEGSTDMIRFLVVKRTGSDPATKAWEPPKGQMEGKDTTGGALIERLGENIRREVSEEAKIDVLKGLRYTGLVVQSHEPDYPKGHYFQYHIFQAFVPSDEIHAATQEFAWYKKHPAAFARLRSDKKEKDDITWFDPNRTKLMGKWSPSLVALYLQNAGKL